ncbi:MAG TPA: response regulator [Alphaproteobacteria bacterium]|nr:response regulator [Alphaproteobacteria bacterium]
MNARRNTPFISLEGLNILIVEDEAAVSFLVEDMLQDLGCTAVWHASSVKEALDILGDHRPDAAVLDVNLRDELAYPVAEKLDALGIPFIFATGYGRKGIPSDWLIKPVVQKPFDADALRDALNLVLWRERNDVENDQADRS